MFDFPAVLRRTVVVTSSFALLVGTVAAEAGEWVPAERRLPPNVVYFRSFRDLPQFRRNASETATGRLWADPQFRTWTDAETEGQSMHGMIEAQSKLVREFTEETCGIRPDNFFDSITGDATVAVIRSGENKPELVWFLEIGDDAEEFAKKRAWLASWLCDGSAREIEANVRGTRCLTLEPVKAPASFDLKRISYFTKDSYVVVATTAELLASILDRWDGNHKLTLAGDKTFQAIGERTGIDANARGGEFIWFSRGSDVLTMGSLSWLGEILLRQIDFVNSLLLPDTDEDSRPCSACVTPAFSRDSETAVGGVSALSARGYDMVRRTAAIRIGPVRAAAGRKGRPPSGQEVELATKKDDDFDDPDQAASGPELLPRDGLPVPPRWIRTDVRRVDNFRWNMEAVAQVPWPGEWLANRWTSREVMSDFQTLLCEVKEHIPAGMEASLTGNAWLIEAATKPDKTQKSATVLALEIRDEKGLRTILEALESAKAVSRSKQKVGSDEVWQIMVEQGWFWSRGRKPLQNRLTIAHGHLFLGESINVLTGVINADPEFPVLAEDPEYQAAMAHIPKASLVVSYERALTNAELFEDWGLVPPKGKVAFGAGAAPAVGSRVVESFSKYFGAEAGYLEGDGTSVRKTYFRLRAPR